MLGLKVRNRLTGQRLALLLILVGAEAFLIPVTGALSQGSWPTEVQVAYYACTAVLQIVTLAIGLIKKEEQPPET